MRIVCISSGLSPQSRSERIGKMCVDVLLARGVDAKLVSLKDKSLERCDPSTTLTSEAFRELDAVTESADGLILASPVYNWGVCAELKKYVECVGHTDTSRRTPFFDKVLTFVAAAGLPHSYTAFGPLALSMMMDFKCIINPYTVYVHNRHWEGDQILEEARSRIEKSMLVMAELTSLFKARTYSSVWEI